MSPLTRGPRSGGFAKAWLLNRSAVKSLDEGLEETLTLHRLGVFPILGRSLKTTNCLESIMSLIAQRTDRAAQDQKQRWVATALLDIDRLNRIQGYRHLPVLRAATALPRPSG